MEAGKRLLRLTNEPEFHKPVRAVLAECDPPVETVRVVRGGGFDTIYVELMNCRDVERTMDILNNLGFDVEAVA